VSLQDWASTWLEKFSLEDWANIATIFGAIGTFIVAIAALLVSVGALRTQKQAVRAQWEALPVSAEFGLSKCGYVDGRTRTLWVYAWMLNTGVRAYLHNFYPEDWDSTGLAEGERPHVASIRERKLLPRDLRELSRGELKYKLGVFYPRYLAAQDSVTFLVSFPPGIQRIMLGAEMSFGRRGQLRYASSGWLEVPRVDELDMGNSKFSS
jgi:hypothetical protein